MSDYSISRFHKPTISTVAPETTGVSRNIYAIGGNPSSTAWPSANLGMYVPFSLAAPYNLKKVWWANGTVVSGTVDCGIYTVGGTRLASIGPTTQASTSVVQSVSLSILLVPGSYYMALSCSNTTATFIIFGTGAATEKNLGTLQQASVGTLPATATFATFTQIRVPLFGIASAGVI